MPNTHHGLARTATTMATVAILATGTIGSTATVAAAAEPRQDNGIQQQADPTWAATVDGKHVTFDKDADGVWTAQATQTGSATTPTTIDVTDGTGTVTLKPTSSAIKPDTATVGVTHTTGETTYEGDGDAGHYKLTVQVDHTEGAEITATNADGTPVPFKDGAADVTATLDPKTGTPGEVSLSNGDKVTMTWDKPATIIVDGKPTLQVKGTGTADIDGTWHVTVNATAQTSNAWTITGHGTPATGDDGTQTLTLETGEPAPATLEATSETGQKVTLQATPGETKATPTDTFGRIHVAGTATYHKDADPDANTPAFDITIDYAYDTGDEITLKDGAKLTKGADGTWTATIDAKLSDGTDGHPKDTPLTDKVEFNDGEQAIDWKDSKATVIDKDGATYVSRTVHVTGTRTITPEGAGTPVTLPYDITVDATRTEDRHLTELSVSEAKPGVKDPTIHDLGFKEGTTDYTLTLPHSSVNSSFTLAEKHGVDAQVASDVKLGTDGSRILTLKVDDLTYTVTVSFQAADIQADSPAKLTGIYVNTSGQATKGDLIKDWDPNRLAYTVTIGENDPSPYILPEWDESTVTVTAGDVTQNADSARQEFTVATKDGSASRVYSVTTIRQHSWKTADEAFTPGSPAAQDATVEADGPQDTQLASHGWLVDGKYTATDQDSYRIPEGGVFSYEPKKGQSVSVSVKKLTGMTYEYTVSVLAPDKSTFGQHVYKVVHITHDTNLAELTGLAVNGKDIPGFDPARHDYTVAVADPGQWTLSPRYDKMTGMSVKTTKSGADANVTVTSADGLNQVTYHVHVTNGLANTGVSTGGLAGAIGMILTALVGMVAARRHGRA